MTTKDPYANIRRALASFDACGSHYWRDELARECGPDTIRALLAERDALARDAARYQWLCARWGRISETYEGDRLILIEDNAEGWDTNPESLDAAIDAAIAAANGGTQ